MPPRQYVPSTWAGHTGSCRSGPVRPMSSWVWTAPGRSTITTRPVSSAGDRRHGQRLGVVAGPAAERVRQHLVQVDTRQVTDDDRGGRGGPHVSLVEGADGRRVDPRDGLLGALAGPGHPRGRREQLLGELPGRPLAGLASSCGIPSSRLRTSRSTSLSANAGARSASASSPSAWGRRESGNLEREPRTRVVGLRVEGGAAALQLGGELLGGVLVRALGQRVHHDGGDAVEPAGLGVQRRVQADLHGDDLLPGPVAAQHGQPVGQDAAVRRGERPGLRRSPAAAAGTDPWSRRRRSCSRFLPARRPARPGCPGAAARRPPPGPPRR